MKNNFNPPFSLFREYVKQLMDYSKKFIVLGNMNAITYKEIFPYIKGDMLWWGHSIHSGDRKFYVPENYPLDAAGCGVDENGRRFIRVKGVRWFTNVTNKSRNTPLDLYKRYSNEYPKYDNYDAIEVGKTCDIPMDYNGVMGVPITFLDKYCPEQFEILDMNPHFFTLVEQGFEKPKQLSLKSYGMKDPYARILIRKRTAFREYVKQLMDYGKKFIIIGNTQAITYKEIFPYIKNNELWLGVSSFNCGMYFNVPEKYEYADTYKFDRERDGKKVMRVSSICWFTNIEHSKRNIPIDLYKRYSNEYKHYDNYDAIDCGKVAEIPMDYNGVIGVPITFLDKYCPEQFEIVKFRKGDDDKDLAVNGKTPYFRILIKRKLS